MWLKNLQIYRLPNFRMTADALADALAPHSFVPATSSELIRQGWTAPRGDSLVHTVGGQMLLMLKTEKKLMPAIVVNEVAKARAIEMEEAQGFSPGKKAMKELKERVADELLPQAFSIPSTTAVWIDPVNGWLCVDAASPAKADDVIKLLLKAVDRMPLESLRVQRSPVAVMTAWLETDEAPVGFTIDQDTELRATGESKASVRYVKHALEHDDIGRHIAAGKHCVKLAMTWDDKISFVLTESLAIKSIKPLDVLRETGAASDDDRFDSDFALMTGELAKMLADVVEALGGEATTDATGEPAAPAGGAAKGDEPVREQRAAGGQQKFERAVGLTAELYKNRDTHKAVLGELYVETVKPYIERLEQRMAESGEGAIKSAIELSKIYTGATSGPMFLVAAVEIMQPSAALAQEGAA